MRQEILRPLGLVTGSATATTSTTVVTDSKLSDRFPVDDYFNDQWFLHLTSGTDAGAFRRVDDYVGSTGAVTVSGSDISGGDQPSLELSQFHPEDVKRAYNRARQVVFPRISMVRDVETVVTGESQFTYTVPSSMRLVDRVFVGNRKDASGSANLLLNGDFSDWTGDSADNWTLSAGSDSEETGAVNHLVLDGSSSRVTIPDDTAVTYLQTYNPSSSSYTAVATEGVQANVSAWVYCVTSGRVKIRIGATDYGDFHGGSGWERMAASADLAAGATSVAVGLSSPSSIVAAITIYVDEVSLSLGQSGNQDLPYDDVRDWEYTAPAVGASDGGTIRLRSSLGEQRRLRLVGRDLLSPVSSDSDTVEVDGELLEPLYFKVRQFLCEERSGQGYGGYWSEQADRWRMDYEASVKIDGVTVRAPMVAVPRTVF
jgi:hypothetical protein|tara:strand:- start:226 stop:1509 length:1284 start_codon:yes stop_codon:yes gene_type:complete